MKKKKKKVKKLRKIKIDKKENIQQNFDKQNQIDFNN